MEQHETEAALLPNIANQMRSLLSNLYLAASQVIPPEQREQDPALDAKAAILEQSFFRLLRLVNSMSAAEYLSDSQTLSLRDADLVKLVSEVCESSADLAEQLGIQLKFVCAMDRRVCAIHPAAVEQMLYHLLSNALKFTPAGGTVTVELKKSGETLRLTVSDTGCGIPPERMAHLFDGCFQPGHPSPAPYGLGLGLPLCRAIAEKHGGHHRGVRPRQGQPLYGHSAGPAVGQPAFRHPLRLQRRLQPPTAGVGGRASLRCVCRAESGIIGERKSYRFIVTSEKRRKAASACRKILFAPLTLFSELYKSSENV